MISGKTSLIAHIGYPTDTFKAPLIYNPWFDAHGIDAVVVPIGVMAEDYPSTLRAVFKMTNVRGALITMPHKVTTLALADEVSTTARIAGAANALRKASDGRLIADMFDGTGFTRGLAPSTFVGEMVMKREITPLLAAAQARGCQIQVGTDMLFEMIPAYLEFFGFGTATPQELRTIAKVAY